MEKNSTMMDFDSKQVGEEIVLPSFAEKYTNIKTKIEKFEIHKGNVFEGKQSYYIKFITHVVGKEKIKNKESGKDETIEIRATEVFGIRYENGKYNWSDKSELALFLRRKGLKSFTETTNLPVLTSAKPKKDKIFLGFI